MDGSIKTIQSAWNGPPGKMVKAIGNCFHPDTKMKLKNGKNIKMKNLKLGDYIENGSKVCILMKIHKEPTDFLYKLSNVNNSRSTSIYVTGTHIISYNNKYIMVKDHPDAVLDNEINCDYFSCIITDDHLIKIGDYLFYDWDDDEIRNNI